MAMNRIQFQPGLSLLAFFEQFGTELAPENETVAEVDFLFYSPAPSGLSPGAQR